MIGTRTHLRNVSKGTGFEFPVLEDGEINATYYEFRKIDGDAAFYGIGIYWVRKIS